MPKTTVDGKLIERKDRPMMMHAYRDAGIVGDADRVTRYAKVAALLDQWADEPGDFDGRIDPLIAKALRDSALRHFPES